MKNLFHLFRLIKILFLIRGAFSCGDRLTKTLKTLGPVFIKFGQSLSTRADIVGEEIADKLMELQDKLPSFSFDQVKQIIESEFGGKLSDHFSYFEEKPVAAASIAQVHRAITCDGTKVAVKVRRPKIVKEFAKDIDFLYFIAGLAEKFIPKAKKHSPKEIVAIFDKSSKFELDFCFEAAALSEMRENFSGDESVYIPKPYWDLTSHLVLTMDWVEGIPINDLDAIDKASIDRKKIASNLSILFFNQAYRNGFFHGDLHGGNILVNDKHQIILIDFGITGRLSKKDRIFVANVLKNFLEHDYLNVAKIHYEEGFITNPEDIVYFAQTCRSIGEQIVGLSANKMSVAKLLSRLFKACDDYDMNTRPQLLLLQKTILMVEGIGSRLDPSINMWKLAEPWIEQWAIENLGIEAKLLEFAQKISSKIKEMI